MLTYSTVTGRILSVGLVSTTDNPLGATPVSGMVVFTPSVKSILTDVDGVPTTLFPKTIIARLDQDGDLTYEGSKGVPLLATNEPTFNPTNFTYEVSFNLKLNGSPVSYSAFDIAAPVNTQVNLATVAPVTRSNGVAITRGDPGVSIDSIALVGTDYVYTMSDGTTRTAPAVAGPPGSAGRGITSITDTDLDGTATILYTDNTTELLPLPPGPKGDPGTGAAYELRGTGMPEGVVTADPGYYYTDSAGTNGAWRWIKTSGTGNTGWSVIKGDTGWRSVAPTGTGWTANNVLIRRKDETVYISYVFPTDIVNHSEIMVWPAGFTPPNIAPHGGGYRLIAGDSAYKGFLNIHATGLYGASVVTGGSNPSVGGSYPCTDAWPTVLPGTAA